MEYRGVSQGGCCADKYSKGISRGADGNSMFSCPCISREPLQNPRKAEYYRLNMRTETFNSAKEITSLNDVKWLSQHSDIFFFFFFFLLRQTVVTQIIAAD